MTIDEQLTYLRKGMAEIIREEDLRERLIQAAKTGRKLRVKAGFDRTTPYATVRPPSTAEPRPTATASAPSVPLMLAITSAGSP